MRKVMILDTTLRDDEQAAGTSLNLDEKLEIARQLDKLGADVIEAGFPVSPTGDFEAVRLIARELKRPTICALTPASIEGVDKARETAKEAGHPRIHVALSASGIHPAHQLEESRATCCHRYYCGQRQGVHECPEPPAGGRKGQMVRSKVNLSGSGS